MVSGARFRSESPIVGEVRVAHVLSKGTMRKERPRRSEEEWNLRWSDEKQRLVVCLSQKVVKLGEGLALVEIRCWSSARLPQPHGLGPQELKRWAGSKLESRPIKGTEIGIGIGEKQYEGVSVFVV